MHNPYKYGNTVEGAVMRQLSPYVVEAINNTGNHAIEFVSNDDSFMEQVYYCQKRTEYQVALFLHTNAGTGNNRGCNVLTDTSNKDGVKLGNALLSRIAAETPSEDGTVYSGLQFPFINATPQLAFIIEVIYHDNADDARWMLSNIQTVANAIANAIVDVYGGYSIGIQNKVDDMPTPAELWNYVDPDKKRNKYGFSMSEIMFGTNGAVFDVKTILSEKTISEALTVAGVEESQVPGIAAAVADELRKRLES